jgi:uncharacterized protein YabN with tetrapyrrole methylase and pyrophosphatase domain
MIHIKEQEGAFILEDVLEAICAAASIRRHPHIFGNDNDKVSKVEEIVKNGFDQRKYRRKKI